MDTPTQEEHWGEILERTVSKQNLMLVNVGTNGTILNHQQTFPRFYKVEPIETIKQWLHLKFRTFKKATKFETNSHLIWRLLSKCQIKLERMFELYHTVKNKSTSWLKAAFFQKVWFVFQISKSKKKYSKNTILSLKFEFVVYYCWREI